MNDDTPIGVASTVQEGVTPYVADMTVEIENQNSLEDTNVLESFPPLSTPVTTAGNAPGKSSYAKITGKPSGKKVNVRTLFTPGGNGIDVVVPGKYGLVRSIFSSSTGLFSFQFSSIDGLDAMLDNGPWFIQNNPLILKKWHPDENLLKEDVSTVPVWVKLYGVPVTVDSIRAISERFANTAYGFFLGKKVAYPVVANYVRNTWGKYGLVRSMFSSSTGLFSFQFSSIDGLDAMLENGPWFIRNNPLILKKWHPDENLLKEDVSTVPVWVKLYGVPVTAFSEDGLSAIATKLVMIELRADVELKDNIVVAMPKITREGHYTCNVRVEYEWKPSWCSSCKLFRHIHEECSKNTCAGEKKTVKKPSQTSRGVSIGPKLGVKPQKEYRHIPKKPNASSSSNKKKGVEPTIEVSNSNPFDVLNSVDNDVEFDTNRGTTNLVNNGVTSSGSSFMNIDNDGEFASNTRIGEKIDKIERQICEGKLTLLDNDGHPLVPTGIVESDSEVEVVFDETANLRISTSGKDGSDKGYDANSLLEQWRDSYPDNDDYDPYDDDMYENHDLSEHLHSICDDLDITVRGKKKK
ncbi:ATPase, F1/V1/A1 complex, alpha/beta subunit [Tanacetum coccineum]